MEKFYIREAHIVYEGPEKEATRMKTSTDGAIWAYALIGNRAQEHLVAIYLDSRNNPIAWALVAKGTATEAPVHPREIMQVAFHAGATSFVMAHNHPSGDSDPSDNDLRITSRLREVGNLIGIPLIDSLVVSRKGWHSIVFNEGGTWSIKDV